MSARNQEDDGSLAVIAMQRVGAGLAIGTALVGDDPTRIAAADEDDRRRARPALARIQTLMAILGKVRPELIVWSW